MAFLKFIKNTKFTIILILVVLVAIGYVGFRWYEEKMKLVERGVADSKFPYHEYSLLELARQGKLFDLNEQDRSKFEQELKSLPTRTTPQETFDIYIQALKDGDIEGAVSCMIDGARQGEGEFLKKSQEEGDLQRIIGVLEEAKARISWSAKKIEDGSTGNTEVDYNYSCISIDKPTGCGIIFNKDLYGDWKIYRFY